MAEERVTRGSAGPAQRQPRRRAGRSAAAEAEEARTRPNLDDRERNVSPRRKAMGPVTPPQAGPESQDADRVTVPEVPPTDPQ
jgi:hypothetical protein